MQLCAALARDMKTVAPSLGKEMAATDISTGMAYIKPGDSTPVTAADFAIQGLISTMLQEQFPNDYFMGEEDAHDLRSNEELCALALALSAKFGGPSEREAFLKAVDRGLEQNGSNSRTKRVWVLDPIDGTKGFMTGQSYVIGLALLVDGDAVVGAMGVPNEELNPPLMVAAKGRGLRWWPLQGDGPLTYEVPVPTWAQKEYELPLAAASEGPALTAGEDYPPWLLSPQSARSACRPFGPLAPASELCCGAMIKYFAVAAGRAAGFVQFEQKLKTWDHACGLICVQESGGRATDGIDRRVLFPDRSFEVAGGVVCSSRWATPEARALLLASAPPR
mmetsp:Transcript_65874/g.189538  ORF Transcript_65874/g.189538 Transcript_65874/m.189538 type:complete len:335 (-) Transcript_65874:460-1464(-)